MAKTAEEIKAEISKLKEELFYEEMADFMNWSKYFTIKNKISELENELNEVENNGAI